jgi:hypothetical protein
MSAGLPEAVSGAMSRERGCITGVAVFMLSVMYRRAARVLNREIPGFSAVHASHRWQSAALAEAI